MDSPPTRVRYLVIALSTLASVLLYLDRFCISFAERYVKEDLGLSNEQVGWMLSAFFWTYALAQVPSGFLSDRFGARRMLTLYILLWSLFTGLTGLATGFLGLLVLRFGFGAAQAGAYPTAGSLLSKWVPYPARGFASSLVGWGGRVGGFVAPVLTATLIVAFVPVRVPSLLAPGDILDFPGLCRQLSRPALGPAAVASAVGNADALPATAGLAAGNTSRLGARILERLPPAVRATVIEVGSRSADVPDTVAKVPPDDSEEGTVAGGLNDLLRQRDLYEASCFRELPLPAQAEELLRQPREDLSEAEVERLNRLLLESAYPQAIRKVYVAGWRPVMLTYGLAGLAVAALVWLCLRDRPDLHPRCNAAEVDLIETSRPPGIPSPYGKARAVPLVPLLTSRSMWLNCVMQMGTNVGWVFLVTWLPRYLADVHQVPIERRGWLASIPLMVGCLGMLVGGWLTDRLTRSLGRRWGRALPLALSRFVAMGAYLVCLVGLDPLAATAVFCVVAFATDLGTSSIWAYCQDVGGRHVGSVLGWGNMFGNLGAAVSPLLLNWVVGDGQWHLAFLTCALAFLVSGLCALGVNAAVPIVPPDYDREA